MTNGKGMANDVNEENIIFSVSKVCQAPITFYNYQYSPLYIVIKFKMYLNENEFILITYRLL